jgi:hypothetical protein
MFEKLKKYLYTNNPFYVISAVLVLYGVFNLLSDDFGKSHPMMLMAGLIVYTAVMAGAAVFVVRYAKAWDDIRSVLLIFTLLLVAATILLDLIFLENYQDGCFAALALWLFALVSSHCLRKGLGFQINARYQWVWAIFLSIFILWPVLVSSYIKFTKPAFSMETLGLLMTLFPLICSVIILMLIWADSNKKIVQNYGPWAWPWVPHLGFAFMIGGVFLKTWVLHFTYFVERELNPHTVALYYFPIFYVTSFYLSHLARVHGSRGLEIVSQFLPLGALFVFWKTSLSTVNAELYFNILEIDGAVVYVFCLLLVLQYGIYWAQKIPASGFCFFVVLAALGWVDAGSNEAALQSWQPQNWLWVLGGSIYILSLRPDLKRGLLLALLLFYYGVEGLMALSLSRAAWLLLTGNFTLILAIFVSLSKGEKPLVPPKNLKK